MSQGELPQHTPAAPPRLQWWEAGCINISYYCKSIRWTVFTGHPPYPHFTNRRLSLGVQLPNVTAQARYLLSVFPCLLSASLYISLHMTIIPTPPRPYREFPRPHKGGIPVPARTGCSTPKAPRWLGRKGTLTGWGSCQTTPAPVLLSLDLPWLVPSTCLGKCYFGNR